MYIENDWRFYLIIAFWLRSTPKHIMMIILFDNKIIHCTKPIAVIHCRKMSIDGKEIFYISQITIAVYNDGDLNQIEDVK